MTDSIEGNFLELAALATIGDMMPQEDENLEIIEKGSRLVPNSWRPGIKAFFEMKEVNKNGFEREVISKIISLLNIRDMEKGLPSAYRVLTAPTINYAKTIIENLLEKRVQKREEMDFVIEKMEKEIIKKNTDSVVFEECASTELNFLGSIASVICNRYLKPTFIFRKQGKYYQGAVRMPKGLNGVEAMKECSDILETYGGHPAAGGFKIKKKNIKKFRELLLKYFDKRVKIK
jgi:single-stranded-DNA-specific exonuclease